MIINSSLIITSVLISICSCVTHWRVTETGRIESKEDSDFTLLRPYDLTSFLKQSSRLERLEVLKEIINSKDISTKRDPPGKSTVSVANYQENFYKTDPDCLKASQQLTKFSFYETHYIAWNEEGLFLPKSVVEIKKSDVKVFKKPYCDHVEFEFVFGKTFDHLDSIQSRANITMLPEADLIANLLIEPEDFYGHLVYKSLQINGTSWVYLTMASDYFRIKGDYSNSIKCLQRAIYYAPKQYLNIPLLSLSNMLHKLHFINDSLSVALAGIALDNDNVLFSYYLGNIYVTLGELNLAHVWYDKAARLDPTFRQSVLKKHATACHIKLEQYLEEQHEHLQKKLEELKDYQSYSDEWFHLIGKIELEKSSTDRKEFTRKAYEDFMANSESTICDWDEKSKIFKLNCKKFPFHYTYFPFINKTISLDYINSLFIKSINSKTSADKTKIVDDDYCMNDLETCSNMYKCGSTGNSKYKQEDYTKNSKYDDDLESELKDNDNSILSSSLNHILNEKQIKNRIHPPSQHLNNDHIF